MGTRLEIRLADSTALETGAPLRIVPDGTGRAIALFRAEDGTVHATDDLCTHGQASLAEGWQEDDLIECPVHQGQFCIRTGQAQGFPVTVDVATHPAAEREGGIYVALPTT